MRNLSHGAKKRYIMVLNKDFLSSKVHTVLITLLILISSTNELLKEANDIWKE